ncbi:MAG: hypothetical protein LUI08_06670 [Prevotella sp.]|nr:hypothetical protein [Prevotella sp.]
MEKTVLLLLVAAAVLFASCGAALTGAYLGGSLGSAIGGISNGPRGHDVGMLIGTLGGAAVGAAIETAQEEKAAKARATDQQRYQEEKARLAANRQARQADDYANDNYANDNYANDNYVDDYAYGDYSDDYASGDDVVDIDFGEGSTVEAIDNGNAGKAAIELQNIRFIDADGTNTISRGEQCQITFEIYNAGDATALNIEPQVSEVSTGGKIAVSPAILIESLAAGKGIRYTARLAADNTLRDGSADFEINITLDGEPTDAGVEFSIPTSRN